MIRRERNIVPYLIFLLVLLANGKTRAQETIHLFPDRSFAVSGDTVWFHIYISSGGLENTSEVIHVQMDDLANNHISKVSVLCKGKTGEGYIYIPDSLSTGIYVFKPFSLAQKNRGEGVVNQKLITVYNRFDNDIGTIEIPEKFDLQKFDTDSEIVISTQKKQYERGENVKVQLDIPDYKVSRYKEVLTFAGLADPLSQDFLSGWIPSGKIGKTEVPVKLTEKSGVLISGKVVSMQSDNPVSNVIVILSIPDTVPYFDYCISDSSGSFYFYLRNATGNADLVIQAFAANAEKCKVALSYNYIDIDSMSTRQKMLTYEETTFAADVVKAGYYNKLFKGYKMNAPVYFSMPMQFKYPFYGPPTKTYYPDLFIDLPDFQEISREILYGVQYRERKGETTIRMMNEGIRTLFSQEPLRLLDGIPVFDNSVFTPLGTKDIKKIDAVFYKRFYGDLTFHGVLSVYTKDKSLDWIDRERGISHFKYACLQPGKKIDFVNRKIVDTNVPDLNRVLLRASLKPVKSQTNFNFYTSDIKGNVEISVILIDKNNRINYTHKFIVVK